MADPVQLAVTMTYSPNPAYSLPTQGFDITGVTGYDGDAVVSTSADPTIVVVTTEPTWNGTQNAFQGGVLTGQAKDGTAIVSVSLDGAMVGQITVTSQKGTLETGTPVLTTYTGPQAPAS